MNVLNKLALKNLKLNKKRTIGTIIGIILSVALICAVAGLGTSLKESLVQNAIDETGYYHLEVMDITNERLNTMKNNRDVSKVIETYHIGTSKYEYANDKDNDYFDIYSFDSEDFEKLSYKLIDGRLPNNSNEIVVTKKLLTNDNKKIGDTIELNIGHRDLITGEIGETNTKSYKIVGVISKGTSMNYYGATTKETSKYLNAYISLKNPKEYKEVLPQILGFKKYSEVDERDLEITKFDYNVNRELLRWETFAFSDSTVTMLYSLIGIVMVIIVGTSVFCIRNSFAISSQEKRKMYGMLSSVGTTRKQLKQAVLKEGFILGLIGIPIGIIFGILAVFILIKVCNLIMGDFLFDSGIVFKVTLLPIILTILLGLVTIYFSALGSAKKTSKISPIESLKGNDEIKITSNKLKTPKIIRNLFGTGGVIAYKNLKRSKRKYRTTVISIAISVLTFISMFSFINESFKNVGNYVKDSDYNIGVRRVESLTDDDINKFNRLSDVKNKYFVYEVRASGIIENPKYDDSYKGNNVEVDGKVISSDSKEPAYLSIVALDDATFRSYVKKIGKSYEELKDKAIIFDDYNQMSGDTSTVQRTYKYKKGDKIDIIINGQKTSITMGGMHEDKPYGLENTYYTDGFIVVNKDYHNLEFTPKGVYIDSTNAENTIKDINSYFAGKDLHITNKEDQVKEDRAMLLLVSIFLYGFIAVITLIGVTNIFNTITSNIELRSKEFAMLKSIGMTKKEFKRMVNLETIFYSSKSLFYGIVLGLLGSIVVHKAFATKFGNVYVVPYQAIIISIVAVFILVFTIMRYAMNKVQEQNTIETIRNDNI